MKVRASLGLLVAALAVAAASPAVGGATTECKGVKVCIRVPGPWVVAPAQGEATYLLDCPRRRGVVAGLDARASARTVHVSFDGRLGGPVSPGLTTTRYAFFRALSTHGAGTFQPLLGCIPAAGGGSPRSTVSARATAPGPPTERYAKTVRLQPGAQLSTTQGCARGEHLVGSWHAVAFRTKAPPPPALARLVRVTRSVRGARVGVRVTASELLPAGAHAEVQVGATCAR